MTHDFKLIADVDAKFLKSHRMRSSHGGGSVATAPRASASASAFMLMESHARRLVDGRMVAVDVFGWFDSMWP